MDVKFNQAATAYANAGQMKTGLLTPKLEGDDGDSGSTGSTGSSAFGDMLGSVLEGAKQAGYQTENVSAKAIAGKAQMNDLITSVTNAELTLDTVVAVRDKMISAYQDIIKMTI